MKSYLAGNPELALALNENLVVGAGGAVGAVLLDDCNFHACVRLDDFEESRVLTFVPPDGEFVVLNYRASGDVRAPFRVQPHVEEIKDAPHMLEVVVVVCADLPADNHGANVVISVKCPRTTDIATPDPPGVGASADYDAAKRALIWTVSKFAGSKEYTRRSSVKSDLSGGSIGLALHTPRRRMRLLRAI